MLSERRLILDTQAVKGLWLYLIVTMGTYALVFHGAQMGVVVVVCVTLATATAVLVDYVRAVISVRSLSGPGPDAAGTSSPAHGPRWRAHRLY